MQRRKALVFIRASLGDQHGGNLWVTSLLQSLSRIDDIDFIVVTSGFAGARELNERFVTAFGFEHIFLSLRQAPGSGAAVSLLENLLDKYYFLYERESRMERHVDAALVEIVRAVRPDIILINDIWSAMCFPSVFQFELPCCLITLNNEAAFHRVYRLHSGPVGEGLHQVLERCIHRSCNWIANWRMQRYVNLVFRQCTGIVALTRDDLPDNLPDRTVQAVLPPLLNESAIRWNYRSSRSVFFVGSIDHFPNRLAVEWICRQFAPELHRLDKQIRIHVIGASAEEIRGGPEPANVVFLGQATKDEVVHRMTCDDLFIAPIANGFGAKLKLAECASYGMPFLATRSAMSGLPFLTDVPQFELGRPAEAARLTVAYIDAPDALLNLSHSIITRMRQARAEQSVAWKTFLRRSIEVLEERRAAGVSENLKREVG